MDRRRLRWPDSLRRHPRWWAAAIAGFWLLLVGIAGPLAGQLGGATRNDQADYLPRSTEATRALKLTEQIQPSSRRQLQAVVVFGRQDRALDDVDQQLIRQALQRATRVRGVQQVAAPYGKVPGLVAENGQVALGLVTLRPEQAQRLLKQVRELRQAVALPPGTGPGLQVYVSGPAGVAADAISVFSSIDGRLLVVTVLLVLFLLLAIYRAPLVALAPLVVVGAAYTLTAALTYVLTQAGWTVSSQATSLLVVIMFGAGTDYCLLLVSRYREELRRWPTPAQAMGRALRGVWPTLLASAATVACALLVLMLTDLGSTRALGPVAAIGVLSTMLASLTMLPALLVLLGRPGMWPQARKVAYQPGEDPVVRSPWRRLAAAALQRPLLSVLACSALLGAGCLGLSLYHEDSNFLQQFRKPTPSQQGFTLLQAGFPAGSLSPASVVLQARRPLGEGELAQVARQLQAAPQVAYTLPERWSGNRRVAEIPTVLRADPYSERARSDVATLRRQLQRTAPGGVEVLVGGESAVSLDVQNTADRDLRLIVPLTLLVILLILILLLRALVAPLYVIATVVLSFAASLGLSLMVFRLLGIDSEDPGLLTFGFIFLIALGTDYNVFLMGRAKEEAERYGTREGMIRAVAATGAVITSAGLILAGTFAVLCTLPITLLVQLGLLVALGVLLDTFVVRTVLVPALAELIGDASWWPRRLPPPGAPPAHPPAGPDPGDTE